MLSKLLQYPYRYHNRSSLLVVKKANVKLVRRDIFGLVPPNQYDTPIPDKLKLGYVMRVYWETIPMFFVTFFALGLCFAYIMWTTQHKMDLVFTTHSRANLSHTMDLRCPTVHKIVIINQRYEPWPEMQDVLDKMKEAEKRALLRLECPKPT